MKSQCVKFCAGFKLHYLIGKIEVPDRHQYTVKGLKMFATTYIYVSAVSRE